MMIWIVGAAYALSAGWTLFYMFAQLPLLIFLAWLTTAIAVPLRYFEVLELSWWWIGLFPLIVSFLYGRVLGILYK